MVMLISIHTKVPSRNLNASSNKILSIKYRSKSQDPLRLLLIFNYIDRAVLKEPCWQINSIS